MKLAGILSFACLACMLSIFISVVSFARDGLDRTRLHGHSFTLLSRSPDRVVIGFTLPDYVIGRSETGGSLYDVIRYPAPYIPGPAGAPDLPVVSAYLALPDGAEASVNVLAWITEWEQNLDIIPALPILPETETAPVNPQKNPVIYSENTFYPSSRVSLSDPFLIRGVDVVLFGLSPFRYNPVTRAMEVCRYAEIEVVFEGGSGCFGDTRLRSFWFDAVLSQQLLNFSSLPPVEFSRKFAPRSQETGAEYLIISPDGAEFQQWADTIRKFRTTQGIPTKVVTLSEIGGNTASLIEAYINNAYNNWPICPSAVLCLGDHGTDVANSVIAPVWENYCVSDNIYADVSGNNLPDIVLSRITAQNAAQLEHMVRKFIDYERNPPQQASFYQHPITSCQFVWQSANQLITEPAAGFLELMAGKSANRINTGTSPLPGTWSTGALGISLAAFFGPEGLGYIPATPGEVNCTWNATSQDMIDGINNGAFMLLHKGQADEQGWAEPLFKNEHVNSLTNDAPVFVWSVDPLTGKFNTAGECFAEKIHRYSYNGNPSGALGVVAASEITYSQVTDVYGLGAFDCMFPDFLPIYQSNYQYYFLLPSFANAAGKFFLHQSSWPYNPANKTVTYHLFHHHGDAFSPVFTEAPQPLDVQHQPNIPEGQSFFQISADSGSLIALSVNSQLIAIAFGTGAPLSVEIPPLYVPDTMLVTVTKQNHFRYEAQVGAFLYTLMAAFTSDVTLLCKGETALFSDQSAGNVTHREWFFEGGVPDASSETDPVILYPDTGAFNVTLIVSDGIDWDTLVKENYITVEYCPDIRTAPARKKLTVFPSPAREQIFFDFNLYQRNVSLLIFDMTGNVAFRKDHQKVDGKRFILQLDGFPAGVYCYRIATDTEVFAGRFIVR